MIIAVPWVFPRIYLVETPTVLFKYVVLHSRFRNSKIDYWVYFLFVYNYKILFLFILLLIGGRVERV